MDVQQIFRAPIGSLLDPRVQVCLPGEQVKRWNLNERDYYSLTVLGLPRIDRSEFFPNELPGALPHEFDDHFGYDLGVVKMLEVCLIPDKWTVVGVPIPPATVGGFINSSPEVYVECSWRFYRFAQELFALPQTAAIFDKLDEFLEGIISIDPAVGKDSMTYFWPAVVEGW